MTTYKRLSVHETNEDVYMFELIERNENNDKKQNQIHSEIINGSYNAIQKVSEIIKEYQLNDNAVVATYEIPYGNDECTVKEWLEIGGMDNVQMVSRNK